MLRKILNLLPHYTICREAGVPYMTRYYLLGGRRTGWRRFLPFNLFLHCFHASDENMLHNHPWSWAMSLILWGTYDEERLHRWKRFGPGSINRIRALDFHRVVLVTEEVWTLFLAGRREGRPEEWSFLDRGKLIPWRQIRER